MHFVIDPEATDQVTAIANGRRYQVYWAPGFQAAGTATDPEVRDPKGVVVARDGEVLDDYSLHGYRVCANSDSIFVLLSESGATRPDEVGTGTDPANAHGQHGYRSRLLGRSGRAVAPRLGTQPARGSRELEQRVFLVNAIGAGRSQAMLSQRLNEPFVSLNDS